MKTEKGLALDAAFMKRYVLERSSEIKEKLSVLIGSNATSMHRLKIAG